MVNSGRLPSRHLASQLFRHLRHKPSKHLSSQSSNRLPESFGHEQAVDYLGNGPYLLRAECWTFDWNIGFLRDQMNPTLYFTILNPVNGRSRRLKYRVDTVGYGLKFSHLGLVFGYRSEFSTFGSSVIKGSEVDIKIDSIPKVINIASHGSGEFSIIGTNATWWTLEVDGTRIGCLTRAGTQYLGAGPLLGYMFFQEVCPADGNCLLTTCVCIEAYICARMRRSRALLALPALLRRHPTQHALLR